MSHPTRLIPQTRTRRAAEGNDLDRTPHYEDQAAYCAYLLRRAMEPHRRALIEQERQDWLTLAYQHRLLSEIQAETRANEPARSYAAQAPAEPA